MSPKYPPLTYKEVARGLAALGFIARPINGTSHEHWVKLYKGRIYKVTVDEPKSPFSMFLMDSMASQAGESLSWFYKVCTDKKATKSAKVKWEELLRRDR